MDNIKKLHTKNMNTVKIKGIDYEVRYTLRALFLYEQITKQPFAVNSLDFAINRYIFAYCIVLASNMDKDVLEWDDFMQAMDEDPNIFADINRFVLEQQKKNSMIEGEAEEGDNEGKKD